MWAYIFAVVILLLLWGALSRWALTEVFKSQALKPGQQLAYWALALLLGYALLMAMTAMLLPQSVLALQLGQEAMLKAQSWSYALGFLSLLWLFYRAIKQVYNKPTLLRPHLRAIIGGHQAKASAAKGQLKAAARKRRV